jgi:hypothetical protein
MGRGWGRRPAGGGNQILVLPVAGDCRTALTQPLETRLAEFDAGKCPAYRDLVLASVQ